MRLTAPENFNVDEFYRDVYLFQRWEIFPGHSTNGSKSVCETLQRLKFPLDLSGKRILDIGTWNGFFAFECARRGASEVVALGPDDPDLTAFKRSLALLELENVTYVRDSLYNIPKLNLGTFDYILFLGIIYHLRHPLLALDYLFDSCRELIFVDSAIIDSGDQLLPKMVAPSKPWHWQQRRSHSTWDPVQKIPLVYFSQVDEIKHKRDPANWFMPNNRALQDWISTSGFVIEHCLDSGNWAWLRARKGKRTFEPGLEGYYPWYAKTIGGSD